MKPRPTAAHVEYLEKLALEEESGRLELELDENRIDEAQIAQEVHVFQGEGENVDNGDDELEVPVNLPSHIRRNPCLAHLLQLAIRDVLAIDPTARRLVKKVSDVIAFFSRSKNSASRLKKLTTYALVKSCETRWNSFYDCLTRLLKKDEQTNTVSCLNNLDC